ncbi:hypothetical protein D3C75_1092570 [compost metagenome]
MEDDSPQNGNKQVAAVESAAWTDCLCGAVQLNAAIFERYFTADAAKGASTIAGAERRISGFHSDRYEQFSGDNG